MKIIAPILLFVFTVHMSWIVFGYVSMPLYDISCAVNCCAQNNKESNSHNNNNNKDEFSCNCVSDCISYNFILTTSINLMVKTNQAKKNQFFVYSEDLMSEYGDSYFQPPEVIS